MIADSGARRQFSTGAARESKVYAVDFDGYLCRYAWPEIGEPNTKVIEHFKRLRAEGHKLILWTCREGQALQDAVDWCAKHGLYFDAVNENLPEMIEKYGTDPRKVGADFYCDDRNYPLQPAPETGNVKVILFSGKAENGKSTAAQLTKQFLEERGYRAVKLAFADYVKDTAKRLFGWNGAKDEAGRALLQWWGTDVVRSKDENFWVDTVIRLIGMISGMYDFVLIDDVRFENEIARVAAVFSTYTVRVSRPGYENHLTPEQRVHPSETALDNFPFDIYLTARTISELEEQIQTVLLPAIEKGVHNDSERMG